MLSFSVHGETTTIKCLQCDAEFTMSKAIAEKRGRKFCTPRCAGLSRQAAATARKPTYVCQQCGKAFQPKHTRAQAPQFCSMSCNGASRAGKPRGSVRPERVGACRVCDTTFTTRNPHREYCSTACQRRPAPAPQATCEHCGKEFPALRASSRFCSRACLYAGSRREKSAAWKGGRHVDSNGYVRVYAPEHPDADGMGYVREHRLVMEQELGRPLEPTETVHHINGARTDNRPENLQVRQGKHGKGARYVCLDCGSHNVSPAAL